VEHRNEEVELPDHARGGRRNRKKFTRPIMVGLDAQTKATGIPKNSVLGLPFDPMPILAKVSRKAHLALLPLP
jgi:hypothetical protein